MRAVGFVRKAEHPGVMRHPHNGAQIAADAVVGGVINQHRHGVGVLGNGLGHLLTLHAQTDAEAVVHLRVDVDRHRAAEHQRVQHAAVDIAWQDDFIPALAGRQHHALHRARCAAHHQKGVCRAKRIGGQLLGFADDRNRVAEIVQRLHAVDIHTNALLAQKRGQLRIAAPALVPRHVKGNNAHPAKVFQCFMDGGAALIQPGALCFSVHFYLRSRSLCKTKNASHAQMCRLAFEFSIFGHRPITPRYLTERTSCMIQKG